MTTATTPPTPQPTAKPRWISGVIDETDLTSDPEVIGVIAAIAGPSPAFGSDAERLAAIRVVLDARSAERRAAREAVSR